MNQRPSVLLVDDAPDMLELLRRSVQAMGLVAYTAANVVDAIDLMGQDAVDLVITDLNMPGVGGIQLVRYIARHHPTIPVLVVTGYPNVQDAVEVMKLGAVEYITKPFTQAELERAVNKVVQQEQPVANGTRENAEERTAFHGLIGRSPVMQALYRMIERTSANRATVMLRGESGTGKEMVARAIHYNSTFSAAPFIAVNCGAIPDQLLESELFGHVKGAFTGAATNRVGLFQAADGGTLFLDEIGNASAAVQAKLLRVIQEKEITMLGSTKPHRVQVRLISASNSDLDAMIRQGTFREDLYYRLNLLEMELPPLRARREDIPLLVQHFNLRFSKELGKPPARFTDPVMQALEQYAWPGNVRELEHFIHRTVIMTDEPVTLHDLPTYMKVEAARSAPQGDLLSLAEVEHLHIARVLEATGHNKTRAAEILGIDRKTLREKLKGAG
jgi:two-component system response regulator HydG